MDVPHYGCTVRTPLVKRKHGLALPQLLATAWFASFARMVACGWLQASTYHLVRTPRHIALALYHVQTSSVVCVHTPRTVALLFSATYTFPAAALKRTTRSAVVLPMLDVLYLRRLTSTAL